MTKGNYGLVYVQGAFMRQPTYRIMEAYGFKRTDVLEEADCVVWTGGEDINPALYAEKNVASSFNPIRDRQDLAAIKLSKDKFKVGICRGAQLLNCIPNEGTLWQDVDHHGGCNHEIHDYMTNKNYTVNSVHHQAMRMNEKTGILVSYCQLSTEKISYSDEWHKDNQVKNGGVLEMNDLDAEVVWYPETKSLCVQSHPEFQERNTTQYFYDLMDRFYK